MDTLYRSPTFAFMWDYIIVGLGLAGVSFCETLEQNGKTFLVVDDSSQMASKVAAGLYNPVILKRFTAAWNAKEQLEIALPFYKKLEKKLNITLEYKIPVMRKFASVEEQNLWYEASDKKDLAPFLSPVLHQNNNPGIDAPLGYGQVLGTGKIDTATLLEAYGKYLAMQGRVMEETFDHNFLKIEEDALEYKTVKAKKIVFCEGFGLKRNPYFNYLPLTGTKGEYLIIKAPGLNEEKAIKANIFCIPEGNDVYRIGATYNWKDTTNTPTEPVKKELLDKLRSFVTCDYEVIGQVAGIRPTVVDRRPLVGQHPEHKRLYLLNGFGSRGVLIAPYAARQLFESIEKDRAILPEMDILRFYKKYTKRLHSPRKNHT